MENGAHVFGVGRPSPLVEILRDLCAGLANLKEPPQYGSLHSNPACRGFLHPVLLLLFVGDSHPTDLAALLAVLHLQRNPILLIVCWCRAKRLPRRSVTRGKELHDPLVPTRREDDLRAVEGLSAGLAPLREGGSDEEHRASEDEGSADEGEKDRDASPCQVGVVHESQDDRADGKYAD